MSILITGGAGYIGSHIINLLLNGGKKKEDIIVLDNLSNGKKENVQEATLIQGDLADQKLLESLFSKYNIELVIHLAGSIVIPESITSPDLYYSNNTTNSLHLIKTCLKYKTTKFIFSSTAAVYGHVASGIADELTTTAPSSPYGRSKLMIEWMLQDISAAHDFRYVALRYFNVAGASVNKKVGPTSKQSSHLIKILSEVVAKKQDSFTLYGDDYNTPDGSCIRDFIHIDDLAQAHLLAIDYLRKNSQSQILNCGYGHGHSVKEVIAKAELVSGQRINFHIGDRRRGDIPKLISANQKIIETLGWKPRYDDLEFILKSSIDWEKASK